MIHERGIRVRTSPRAELRYLMAGIMSLIYAGLNFYLGTRGWDAIGNYIANWAVVYWGGIIFLALSYFLGRILCQRAPGRLSDVLVRVGAYYLGFFFYALLTVVFIDILRAVDRILPILPMVLKDSPALAAILVLVFLGVLMVYGTYNSRRPVLRKYRLDISAPDLPLKNLKAILVSDIHLGSLVGEKRLRGLVKKINQRRPDVVFMGGDIIDGELRPFVEQDMGDWLQKIQSRYGVFAVLGNHEYYGGQYREIMKALRESGVIVLRDESIILQESIYIIGRDDKYSRDRKELSELMPGPDNQLPVLVLDHNPIDIHQAADIGADIQFSGHTHTGQIWPLNHITARIFATHWGYLRQGQLQVIVTNGYATWGPPIRIGNRPELVEVQIKFG